jgi:molybdopterin molybdotransferase
MEIEEAVSRLKNALTPIEETESCLITDAAGRVAACDVFAPINVPPFAKSAMDGYAVRAKDVAGAAEVAPVQLSVAGELFAGDWKEFSAVKMPSAVRVMTGSPVPDSFDAVVMQEDTDYGEDTVKIYKAVSAGQNYCAVGEDIKKGELVLKAGTKIGRAHIGLLSSLGIAELEVRRKTRIALISTGGELIPPGNPLLPGKIYSSIAPMLCCAIQSCGQSVIKNSLVKDDEKEIASAVKSASGQADIIITTGGVSVGKKDLLPSVLDSLGVEKLFTRVNIQPGTPTHVGMLNGKLLLCLSGNPYAALANFDIYFYEAISALTGCPELSPEKKQAVLASPYEKINRLRRFVRAYFKDGKVSLPSQNHASSVISNLTDCNCYIDIPAGTPCKPGDKVSVWMIKD